jgi:hypothetical protein
MRHRGIGRREIRRALTRPSSVERLYDEESKWLFRLVQDGKSLEVIAYRRGNTFKVKTVYYV